MAAKRTLVHCRICKASIDRDVLQEGKDWVQPSLGWYYHTLCYADFAKKKSNIRDDIHAEVDNDLWLASLFDYLQKDLKMNLDGSKTMGQWRNCLKRGYTAKGIYFTMRYFYEVKKGDPAKSDGIGIVSYIYNDACQYWVEKEQQDAGICAKIEAQIRHVKEQRKIIIQQKVKKKTKPIVNLSDVRQTEEWEEL